MAERRMFAKSIIDSDAFLDMQQTAQLLYFHLSMRADDDGFINNPKSIMRNVRCSEDDLRLLVERKFIIPFENGIVVIKHWKIHNYIAKDRYKETKYKEEKALLILDENNSYTKCIRSVYGLDTQDRLGKDRLGKDREEVATCACARELGGDAISIFADCGFQITAYTRDEIVSLCEQYSEEWVVESIKRASDRGRKTMAYVKGILSSWGRAGAIDEESPIRATRANANSGYSSNPFLDIARELEEEEKKNAKN